MFSPIPTRIEDILNAQTKYAIPRYQRDYKWGKEEAIELLEDLRNYMGSSEQNLFLGNLIFQKSRDQITLVVDGQQRLTTLMVLLIACRSRACELKNIKVLPKIQEKITFVDTKTGNSLGPRLIASESVQDILTYMGQDEWDGTFPSSLPKKKHVKRQIHRVKPIYETFLAEVRKLNKKELSDFLGALYDSYVIRVEVENETDALAIFERTNARGLDLEISDLLKNHLFAENVEGIKDKWDRIVDNSSGTLLRMLKYFYVSRKGYVLKPQLYKALKKYGEAITPLEMTNQLEDFSEFYRVVKNPESNLIQEFFSDREITSISSVQYRFQKIARSLEALREFGVVQFCPPAYAALSCMLRTSGKKDDGAAKALINLFETFEKYHFINNAICERVGNEVEKLYADTCEKYEESKNFQGTTKYLIDELKKRLANADEFMANFKTVSYTTDDISTIAYIFDRFNNYDLDPGQSVPLYFPDKTVFRKNFTVEHFLPQNIDPAKKPKNVDNDAIHNIGNLLVIYFKDNSALGNASPAEKVSLLTGRMAPKTKNLRIVDEFLADYGKRAAKWDANMIADRAKRLANRAYKEIWKI
ncbi:MAG: DUF262 domain-containing protein [Gammaproteobacteria bacterium]|nr:DUF262 domain-containing protein [Gammaproteobacteria bacterium]